MLTKDKSVKKLFAHQEKQPQETRTAQCTRMVFPFNCLSKFNTKHDNWTLSRKCNSTSGCQHKPVQLILNLYIVLSETKYMMCKKHLKKGQPDDKRQNGKRFFLLKKRIKRLVWQSLISRAIKNIQDNYMDVKYLLKLTEQSLPPSKWNTLPKITSTTVAARDTYAAVLPVVDIALTGFFISSQKYVILITLNQHSIFWYSDNI